MSDTCRLFPPFGDPWPSCLLPSHYLTMSGRLDGSVRCIAPGTWVMFPVSWKKQHSLTKLGRLPVHTNQEETGHALILARQSCNTSYSCNWDKELPVYKPPYSFVRGSHWFRCVGWGLSPSTLEINFPSCFCITVVDLFTLVVGSEIRARSVTVKI